MSYYYNNKVFDTFEIKKTISDSYEFQDTIEIINNESITFDFVELFLVPSNESITNFTNIETIKIFIDWGDGLSDRLSQPLLKQRNTIGAITNNQWKKIQHKFNCEKEKSQIRITVYNSFGDKKDIVINYKVLYKTMYDLGTEMVLYGANTTNLDKVSYVLKQKKSDSVFVVSTLDWREITNLDEIEETIDRVSETFANEFVNEDSIVWDWKSLPSIEGFEYENTTSGIRCTFSIDKSRVLVDGWTPHLEILDDGENGKCKILSKTVINNSDSDYFLHQFDAEKYDADKQSPKSPIYVAFIDPFEGVNGVSGVSDKYYFLSDEDVWRPKKLLVEEDYVQVVGNDLVFSFYLDSDYPKCSLTSGNLILQGFDEDGNYLRDVRISFDLLEGMKKEENTNKYKFTIPIRDIPSEITKIGETESNNIRYDMLLQVNDVLGGEDEVRAFDVNTKEQKSVLEIPHDKFEDYTIGSFDGAVDMKDSSTNNKIDVEWKFENKDIFDQVEIFLERKVKDENVYETVNDWLHVHYGDKNGHNFEGLTTENSDENSYVIFKKTINGNELEDATYRTRVIHKLNMGCFYDSRNVEAESNEYDFKYKLPDIQIKNISPYVKISFDKETPSLSLKCRVEGENINKENVKNIKFVTKKTNADNTTKVGVLEMKYDLSIPTEDLSESNVDYQFDVGFIAQNEDDKVSDRYNDEDKTLKTITIGGSDGKSIKDCLLSLADGYVENLTNANNIYTLITNSDKKDVSLKWIRENTLSDIQKMYKVNIDGIDYYATEHYNIVKDGGEKDEGEDDQGGNVYYPLLYETVEISVNDEYKVFRFLPKVFDKETKNTPDKPLKTVLLETIETVITQTEAAYVQSTDTNNVTVKWNELELDKTQNELELDKILFHRLLLKEGEGENVVANVDVKGLDSYTFGNLNFDKKYQCEMYISSLGIQSPEIKTIKLDADMKLPKELSISFSKKDPIVDLYQSSGKVAGYITWYYDLYHKKCTSAKLFYKYNEDDTSEPKEIDLQKNTSWVQSKQIPAGTDVTWWCEIKSKYFIHEDSETADNDGNYTYKTDTFTISV